MMTTNLVPFLLILFGTANSFPSTFYGTSLQNKIKIAANELEIPEWNIWDTWLQFHTCKYSESLIHLYQSNFILLLAMHLGLKEGKFHDLHPKEVSLEEPNPIVEKKQNTDEGMRVFRLGKRTPMSLRQYIHNLRSRG